MHESQSFTLRSLFSPLTTIKAVHWFIIIGLIVFGNGLVNEFIGDDKPLVIANPVVQSLSNLPEFFKGSVFYSGEGTKLEGFSYRPLQTTYFALVYSLFGANQFPFHLFQLVFHIVSTSMLFMIFKKYMTKYVAFFMSIVFLIHPINSETVFYISGTQDILFFIFGITALWILHYYSSQKVLIISLVLLFLSLLSKEAGILFVVVSWVYVFLNHKNRLLVWMLATLGVLFIYFILRVSAIGFAADSTLLAPIHDVPLSIRLINIPAIVNFYIGTFFFPYNLAMSYHWVISSMEITTFWMPLFFVLCFLLTSVFVYTFLFSKKTKSIFLLFSVWFFIGIGLHLHIIPLDLTVSERWFYFPIAGILGMIGITLETLKKRIPLLLLFIGLVLCLLLSVRTIQRSYDWRTEKILSIHDLRISKEAYNLELLLGGVYYNEGNYHKALEHFNKSLVLYPNVVGYNMVGMTQTKLKHYQLAELAYKKSLQKQPFESTYENIAALSLMYGDPHEHSDFIQNTALKIYPNNWKLWYSLASLEYLHGDKKRAKEAIQRAYELNNDAQVENVYQIIFHEKELKFSI